MKKAFVRIKTVTAPANHLDDFFGGYHHYKPISLTECF